MTIEAVTELIKPLYCRIFTADDINQYVRYESARAQMQGNGYTQYYLCINGRTIHLPESSPRVIELVNHLIRQNAACYLWDNQPEWETGSLKQYFSNINPLAYMPEDGQIEAALQS